MRGKRLIVLARHRPFPPASVLITSWGLKLAKVLSQLCTKARRSTIFNGMLRLRSYAQKTSLGFMATEAEIAGFHIRTC